MRLLTGLGAALVVCGWAGPAAAEPDRNSPGIMIYFGGGGPDDYKTWDELRGNLEQAKAEGFDHVNLTGFHWTLPTQQPQLRTNFRNTLEWAEQNGVQVWLLLASVAYWSDAGAEQAAINPLGPVDLNPWESVQEKIQPWIDEIKLRPGPVVGVTLGNEVGPRTPVNAAQAPTYYQGFRTWLADRHGSLANLNAAWGTNYASFNDIGYIAPDAPGGFDLHVRYGQQAFSNFYTTIIEDLLRPQLGDLGYGSKVNLGSVNPYIYRVTPSYAVQNYDDLMPNQPAYFAKWLSDTDPRPEGGEG